MEPKEEIKRVEHIEMRIKKLELFSHPPNDWEKRIESLENAYMKLYNLMTNEINEK